MGEVSVPKIFAFSLLLWMGFAMGAKTAAQQDPGSPIPQERVPPGAQTAPEADDQRARAEKEMQKAANRARQTELKRDTDRLLTLATELKKYVDQTNENMLSVDVIKKADEIERLAHDVKQKMRGNP
jgi:hypothetical protein